MSWLTLKELNSIGLQIIKGEKCRLRDPDGVCLWHDSQLKENTRYRIYEEGPDAGDYDYWGDKE